MAVACSGDTGLLDHLLRHLVDQPVTAEGDRLKRRHNADGHMEYWLQSLAAQQSGARQLRHVLLSCGCTLLVHGVLAAGARRAAVRCAPAAPCTLPLVGACLAGALCCQPLLPAILLSLLVHELISAPAGRCYAMFTLLGSAAYGMTLAAGPRMVTTFMLESS